MRKSITAVIILALFAAIAYLAVNRFFPGLLPKATTATEQSGEQTPDEASPVIGSIWENNPGTTAPPPELLEPNLEQPPILEASPLTNQQLAESQANNGEPLPEEIAPWPGETPTPNPEATLPQRETISTVSVGEEIQPPPTNAEVLLPVQAEPTPEVIDPREAERLLGLNPKDIEWENMTPEEKLELEHEPTNIFVQRTFIPKMPNGEKKIIRVKVPVVYKSRTLRLTPQGVKDTEALLERSKKLEARLQEDLKESEEILKEWNRIWKDSIPNNALLPESPSLPENQSASDLNRPNNNPDLAPGKAASFEVQ